MAHKARVPLEFAQGSLFVNRRNLEKSTGPRTANYAKQTQFQGGQTSANFCFNKGLLEGRRIMRPQEQTQFSGSTGISAKVFSGRGL